jgi:hypothetical protein
MDWFSSPKIISCETRHTLICDGYLTPIILKIDGWGLLKITAPQYEGRAWFFCSLAYRQSELVINAPMGADLVLRVFNLFGFARHNFQVPVASSLLKSIRKINTTLHIPIHKYSLPVLALNIRGTQSTFKVRRLVFSLSQARVNLTTLSLQPHLYLPKLEVKFKSLPLSSINLKH